MKSKSKSLGGLKRDISERLKSVRISNNLNQNQIAQKLGFTRAYWSSLESGNRKLTFKVILLLNQLFGVSADWLIFGHQKPVLDDPEAAVQKLYLNLDQLIELHVKRLKAAVSLRAFVNNLIGAMDQVEKIDDQSLRLESFSKLEKAMQHDFNDLFFQYYMALKHPEAEAGRLIRPPKKVLLFVSGELQKK